MTPAMVWASTCAVLLWLAGSNIESDAKWTLHQKVTRELPMPHKLNLFAVPKINRQTNHDHAHLVRKASESAQRSSKKTFIHVQLKLVS